MLWLNRNAIKYFRFHFRYRPNSYTWVCVCTSVEFGRIFFRCAKIAGVWVWLYGLDYYIYYKEWRHRKMSTHINRCRSEKGKGIECFCECKKIGRFFAVMQKKTIETSIASQIIPKCWHYMLFDIINFFTTQIPFSTENIFHCYGIIWWTWYQMLNASIRSPFQSVCYTASVCSVFAQIAHTNIRHPLHIHAINICI